MINESGVSREVSEKIPLERPKTRVREGDEGEGRDITSNAFR